MSPWFPWGIVLAGFALMYAPTYWSAAHELWPSDDFGHQPLILMVVLWLAWREWPAAMKAPLAKRSGVGGLLFAIGLLLYAFGRIFSISSAEFLSQPLVIAGAILLLRGVPSLRAFWFPLIYLLFMVPLPGSFVDQITEPLKQQISATVVGVLHALGYPIARTGVTITIGPYELLVADACSGLHSMFSLLALGSLYLYVTGATRRAHIAVMMALMVPIAFVANIVRVAILVLITYHLGDEAGQGFLHFLAGLLLMLISLLLLIGMDAALRRLFFDRRVPEGPAAA